MTEPYEELFERYRDIETKKLTDLLSDNQVPHMRFRSWKRNNCVGIFLLLIASLLAAMPLQAQPITVVVVEIHTFDKRFAGTDDSVHLQIGGRDLPLDDPNRDDFERNNTDRFMFDLSSEPISFELIRGVGQISVTKIEDSFFGGGWGFGGIRIWAGSDATEPLYQNANIDKWLDGDDLEWITLLDEPGWNVPEPPPFPPCSGTGIIFLAPANANPPLDSDCDGTPDDFDPTFDNPPDTDGDGLPDLYETQTTSNPNDSDSDDDGWTDGRNRRSVLVLTRIECDDEEEDVGSDELYLNVEDVRYPKSFDLGGYWAMNDDTVRSPGAIVDSRMLPAGTQAFFTSRARLRESDFRFLESPTDDTFATFNIAWGDSGTTTFTYDDSDAKYVLTFRWFTMDVRDPTLGNFDTDRDGLDEGEEAKMSIQDSSVQPVAAAGHNGLSDPERRELWVEVDAAGSDQRLDFDAKQMVASQFAYHGIAPRFDDGWFGNEDDGLLDYVEVLRPADIDAFRDDTTKFRHERRLLRRAFRYVLMVDDLEDGLGEFGDTRCGVDGCRSMVGGVPGLGHSLTFESQPIIFMHELGHTLGLCHRVGDYKDPINPSTCPAPANVQCADFCGIGQESNTAMGSEPPLDSALPIIGGGLTGIGGGIVGGALVGSLFGPVGTIVGAVVGGIFGGIGGALLGAVLGADFYARDVDYHIREWQGLRVARPA